LGAGAGAGSGKRERSGKRHFQKLPVRKRVRKRFLYNIYFYIY